MGGRGEGGVCVGVGGVRVECVCVWSTIQLMY